MSKPLYTASTGSRTLQTDVMPDEALARMLVVPSRTYFSERMYLPDGEAVTLVWKEGVQARIMRYGVQAPTFETINMGLLSGKPNKAGSQVMDLEWETIA